MGLMAMLCRQVAKRMNLHEIPDRTDPSQTYVARHHTADKQENASWFLHNIKLEDKEPYKHSHPYSWQGSIILAGSYDEEYFDLPLFDTTPIVNRTRRVRFFNWIPGNRYHRITRLHGEVWTLFVHGPKHGKSWGFWLPGIGHVHNELMQRYFEWQNRTREQSSVGSLPN